jgi:hypothetical protein
VVEQHHPAFVFADEPKFAGKVLGSAQDPLRLFQRHGTVNQVASERKGLMNASTVCGFMRSEPFGCQVRGRCVGETD